MNPTYKRLLIFLVAMISIGSALALIVHALSNQLIYYKAPSQLLQDPSLPHVKIRLGGMVMAGSIHYKRIHQTPQVQFNVTDGQADIQVNYEGILPDLFREGQSVIAIGYMTNKKIFIADEILAKHDETYMPKEVAEALRKSGKWDPKYGPPPDAKTWNHILKPQFFHP